MATLFLVAVFYLGLPPDFVLVGVCWHLHRCGFGWSSDETQARSLAELAARVRDRRLARRAVSGRVV
jgi:hypothetical protein